ncbi:hypothetical protein YC2023_005571 [Brassica napus]
MREKSKEEAVKKWEKKKECSSPKGVGKVRNKKKGRFKVKTWQQHLDEFSNGYINNAAGVSSSTLLNEEEDEEDDSDWEHLQQRTTPIEFVKWCCVNCTMANPGDMLHCYICGDHKESGILRHGCFASPFFKDTGLTEVQENCGGRSSAARSTAVDCGLGKTADKLLNACSPHHVGTNGDEGYCVNVPWSCGGVGDNVYIYAFQQVVIPIVGFDAARGDPLECCDVITPAGYSRMTQMLGDLCGGKMLVILEGGYNELPIATTPSRAGLQTVIDIMNIQMKFCPLLATAYSKLLSEKSGEKEACSGPYMVEMESKEALYNISRFCSVFLLRADIIVFYTNGVTCELKSLLEPRHTSFHATSEVLNDDVPVVDTANIIQQE